MSMKDELFFPGWWKYAISGFAMGFVLHVLCAVLSGCAQVPPQAAEPGYPEYDKWWEAGVYEHDGTKYEITRVVTTNDVMHIGRDGKVRISYGVVTTNSYFTVLL